MTAEHVINTTANMFKAKVYLCVVVNSHAADGNISPRRVFLFLVIPFTCSLTRYLFYLPSNWRMEWIPLYMRIMYKVLFCHSEIILSPDTTTTLLQTVFACLVDIFIFHPPLNFWQRESRWMANVSTRILSPEKRMEMVMMILPWKSFKWSKNQVVFAKAVG